MAIEHRYGVTFSPHFAIPDKTYWALSYGGKKVAEGMVDDPSQVDDAAKKAAREHHQKMAQRGSYFFTIEADE